MHGLLSYEQIPFLLQAVALCGALVRIFSAGLHRIYRFFTCYLLAKACQLAIPLLIARNRRLYGNVYMATEGLIVCLSALVVLELYTLILKDLTGLATVSKSYIRKAIGAAIVLAIVLLDVPSASWLHGLAFFLAIDRTIVCSLLVFVFLITAFLAYYPIPLNRNVIFYSIGYAFYFTCQVAGILTVNSGEYWVKYASLFVLVGSTLCLFFWAVFLNARGEEKTLIIGHRSKHEDEERVLGQLKAFSATLARARK